MLTNDEAIEKFKEYWDKEGWSLFVSDSYNNALVVEKVDELNKFEDDAEASKAAQKAGVPFIEGEGIEPLLYVDTVENRKLLNRYEVKYLDTPRNRRIAEIIKETGACGEVIQIDDVLMLNWNPDKFSCGVICETTEGPQWGVLIINGKVWCSSGTGLCTAGEFIEEYIRTDGDIEL